MKVLKRLVIVLLCIVGIIGLFLLVVNLIPTPKVESTPFTKVDRTLISAHRGGGELNPENTEKAFDYVINETSYVDIIEMDVKLTKDNVPVIIHDEAVNAYALDNDIAPVLLKEHNYDELIEYNLGYNFVDRNGNRPYKDLSIAEAKAAGLTLMKLDDFLTKYEKKREFLLYLEIKEKGEPSLVLAEMILEMFANDEYTWWKERTMVISSSDAALDLIASRDNSIYIGAVGFKIAGSIATSLFLVDSLFKPNFHCVQTYLTNTIGPLTIDCATKRFVNAAHRHNQSVCYWGINEEADMQHLIEIGADTITTDAPDKLAQLLGILVE